MASIELPLQFGKREADLRLCVIRVHLEAQQEGLNPRMRMQPLVGVYGGDPLSVVEGGRCFLKLTGLPECRAKTCVEPAESWVVVRKQRSRALQQVHCRQVVAAVVCGDSGHLEVRGRAVRQRGRLGIGGP